jgi:hypothetical protein
VEDYPGCSNLGLKFLNKDFNKGNTKTKASVIKAMITEWAKLERIPVGDPNPLTTL